VNKTENKYQAICEFEKPTWVFIWFFFQVGLFGLGKIKPTQIESMVCERAWDTTKDYKFS